MATLTMTLAAVLVAGSAPAKVSVEIRQPLDLRGEWYGEWHIPRADGGPEVSWEVARIATQLGKRCIEARGAYFCLVLVLERMDDKGHGKFCSENGCLGIYQQWPDRTVICFRRPGKPRPVTFQCGNGQHLIILRRVNPDR